jgi:hypothetical protein
VRSLRSYSGHWLVSVTPLRLAVIAQAHFDTVRLPQPPAWLQRAGLALGAPLGRLLRYEATYEPQAGTPAVPAV